MILAQVNWEQAGVFAGTVIVALGGQKGLERLIVAWRGRTKAPVEDKEPVGICPVHRMFESKLDERHEQTKETLDEIKTAVGNLAQEIHDWFRPPNIRA